MDFCSFHTHTTLSYGDGHGTVHEHVQRVAGLGMEALAVSEHGNITSHAALEKECREAGIKPIFGIEAYFAPPNEKSKFHITLFAMNELGYRNLCQIVTQSYRDFYQSPTVSWESLVKYNEGIVTFSGCSDSLISCTLLGGKSLGEKRTSFGEEEYHDTRRRIERFQHVFKDRFYLEVQRFPGLERTCVLNPAFAELSRSTGAALIATADVHYPFPYQNEIQKTLHAARRGSTIAITDAEWEYDILLTYPESDNEIHEDLMNTGLSNGAAHMAIQNTKSLAELCTVELPKAKPLRFHGLDMTAVNTEEKRKKVTKKFIWGKIREGWAYRVNQRPELKNRAQEYNDRIQHEMKVIYEKDFMDYFLVESELIIRAKERQEVVGPARGSAAACLVAYLLRITEIDPLHPIFNRMVFERFIDPTRSDMPDIDLDFDDEKRINVVNDAKMIYGEDNVVNISNHTKYKAKNSLRDVAKAYGIPAKVFEPIGERAPERVETDDRLGDTIADVIESFADDENSEVYAIYQQYKEQIEKAMAFEGNDRDPGTHAAGFALSSDPIVDVTAIYARDRGSGRNITQVKTIPYDKRDAEKLGFLKMDFLGLKTCGMLGKCLELTGITLEEMYGKFYKVYLDDGNGGIDWKNGDKPFADRIMKAFQNDDLVGIFQFEGGTTRQACGQVFPETFAHLADINALSRPGPYYGGQKDAYVKAKATQTMRTVEKKNFIDKLGLQKARRRAEQILEGEEYDIEPIHPDFDKHVLDTYGQIVYQEQIMFLLRDLAGFDVAKVLKIRKIIGKKLGEHEFQKLWADFRDGCISNGFPEDKAARVWSAITTAAGYAFNIAHSFSYCLLGWWQQWFKQDYPEAFFAASLYKNGNEKEKLPRRRILIKDAELAPRYLEVLPFDISTCDVSWSIGEHRWGSLLDPKNTYTKGLLPGFEQIDGIGELTAKDIVAQRNSRENIGEPFDSWDDLLAVKGIGAKTIERIKVFVNKTDPLGINKVEEQLALFRDQIANGEFAGTGLPDEDEFYMSNMLPGKDYCAFVGFVQNIVYRDEVEQIRKKTGQDAKEIRQELENSDLTKKAVLFAYDEIGEVALRISRWRYPHLANVISQIKKDHHLVVAWGRTYETNARSVQVTKLWGLDPDE